MGSTLCKLFSNENSLIFDIFLVVVDSVISPVSPVHVHVGGRVNFMIFGEKGEGSERWVTEDKSVVEIEAGSGRAKGVGVGGTNVVYKETIEYSTKVLSIITY